MQKETIFFIIADRATGFIWGGQYLSMSTENTIDLLKRIIIDHGKPLEFTSDFGPAFKGKFTKFCKDNFIFHRHSAAYMPAHNGTAEVSIRKIELLIKNNPINSGITLQALVATANNRQSSVTGAASAYTRLTGLKPRLGLPSLPATQSEQDREKIQEKLNAYMDKISNKIKRSTHQNFKIGDKVFIFKLGQNSLTRKDPFSHLSPMKIPFQHHIMSKCKMATSG